MKSHFFLRKRTKSKKNPKNTSANPFQPKSQPNPVAKIREVDKKPQVAFSSQILLHSF